MSERMQALLSRAAEEQLNEQRQVSVVLGDLRQLLTGLSDRVDALARRIDDQVEEGPSIVPESLSALQREVSGLDDRLEVAARRPVLDEQTLQSSLAPVFTRLDTLDERLSGLTATADRLPAVVTTLGDVSDRVDALSGIRDEVAGVRAGVSALQEDQGLASLASGVAAMREEIEQLGGRIEKLQVPTGNDIAAAVSQQVTDRLVDEVAPRVADLVMHKMASTLVDQVSSSVSASVQGRLTEEVRLITSDSERRISAHVDDAVLALAEALLRRRRTGRGLAAPTPDTPDPVDPEADLDAPSPSDAAPEPVAATSLEQPGDAGPPQAAPKEDLGEFAESFDRPATSPDDADRDRDSTGGAAARTAEPDLPEVWPADLDRPQAGAEEADPATSPVTPRRTSPVRAGQLRSPLPPTTPPVVAQAPSTQAAEVPGGRTGPFEWEPQPPPTAGAAAAESNDPVANDPVANDPVADDPVATTQALSSSPLDADAEPPDEWYDGEGEDGPRRRPWWRPGG